MDRKVFTLLFTLLMSMVGLQAFAAWDTSTKVHINSLYYYLDKDNLQAQVTSMPSGRYLGYISIPDDFTYQGKVYSVTSIGEEAFVWCSSLTSVTIPNSVTSIGNYAFCNCFDLTSITIPNSVTSIGNDAFCHCSGLTSVVIPDGVTSIGNSAFFNCSALTSITIPNSVTSIDDLVFWGCTSLTSITIPNSVTSIGSNAFYGCSALTSIIIPNSVTSIGDVAFCGCSGLVSVTIGNSVTSIGNHAFSGCESLSSVIIPNSVTSIGNSVFKDCSGLITINIGNSVTSIGTWVFEGCSGLTSINVESGNTKYDSRFNCNAIIETASNTLLHGCKNTVIPNSVTNIGPLAFYRCYGLTSITIPNSVTSIGSSAFYECNNLTSVTVGNPTPVAITQYTFSNRANATLYVPLGAKPAYQTADYWKEFKKIIEIPYIVFADANVKAICIDNWDTNDDGELSEVEAAAVTDLGEAFKENEITSFNELSYFTGLTSIDDEAFVNCRYLTSIIIPNSVTSIGEFAFENCCVLTSITIPNSVTSIGKYAFAKCSSLTSITMSNSVTSIGDRTFFYCSSLTSITIPNSVTSIGRYAFRGCSSLTSVTIPNSVTSIGEYAFYGCSSLNSITIPNSVTSIRQNTFYECTSLTSAIIGNGVTSIGSKVFYGCSGLISINIGNSVTSIGADAFRGCSGLTSIVVNSGNTVYDSRNNCNAIIETASNKLITGCKNTVIPNSVTSIGSYALSGCSALTSIAIPNSVTSVGWNAFYGCSDLTSIIIGNSVTSIGKEAFGNCDNLTSVVLNIDLPIAITKDVFSNRANATLYVPKNSKTAYATADYWSEFKVIKEFPDADVNQDGVVNVVDVVDIARYVVDDPSPSFDKFLADLNGSGEVSVTDAVVLVNEIAGETSWARRSEQSTAANDQLLLFANADNSLSLHLEGDGQYTAFQLDLHLPADVDLTKALLNAQRKQKHQLLYNKVGEGVYRIIGLSTSGRTFLGNAGELLNMQLDDFATEDVMMDNIHFITPAAADVLFEPVMLTTETTGIAAVNKTDGADHRVVYNLNGQRIAAPQKGLNIVNGKKLIVK